MRYLIIIIMLFVSCKSNKTVVGYYVSGKHPYRFTIKLDSTFTYEYSLGPEYQYSNGFWQNISSKKIKLQSFIKDRTIPIVVEERGYDKEVGRGLIMLSISTNIQKQYAEYYKCSIFIDESLYIQKRCDSLSLFKVPAPKLNLYFKLESDVRIPSRFLDELVTSKYSIKNNEFNIINVMFQYNDSLFNYKVFNDVTLRVSNNKLIYESSVLPKWTPKWIH
jgi:hypothetical protein